MQFIDETDNQAEPGAVRPGIHSQSEGASSLPSPEAREAALRGRVVSFEPLHDPRIKRAKEPAARPYPVEPCQQAPILKEWEILGAIQRAERGIAQYLEIMELVPRVNVANDRRDFQRRFNAFYRVMKRSRDWYSTYYEFMERRKCSKPTFEETLDHFWSTFGRCEASFSSKLVATPDPMQPIWDSIVLGNVGMARPKHGSKDRLGYAKSVYHSLCNWYARYVSSDTGRLIISTFDQNVREHTRITDVKKIDFVLWQMRAQQAKHVARTSAA